MCVVLLRRNLDQTMWPAVGAPGQTALKAGLLDGVITETDITVRKAIADTISKLASITSKSGPTPAPCYALSALFSTRPHALFRST